MKAAIVEKPGVLSVQDIPMPKPGDYEVLCELPFGATCTGTDQHLIHGRFPWKVTYPTILGHESVGRVIEVGPKVRHLRKGDLITRVGTPSPPGSGLQAHWGGYAQFGIAKDFRTMEEDGLPKSEWGRYRVNQVIPPEIDAPAATMFITWRETLSYITRMGVRPGTTALILGSGGTGLSFVSHARNLGAARVAVAGNSGRESVSRKAGATDFFDYKAESLPDQIAQSNPVGFDFLIDSVGKKGLVDPVLRLLKPGGTVGIYGIDDYAAITINPWRSRGTFTFYNNHYDEAEAHDEVVAHIRSGALDARLFLDLEHPFPLSDINSAFQALHDRRLVKALIRLAD